MQSIVLKPIACVRNERSQPKDDHWGGTRAVIELIDTLPPEALTGIEQFSHLQIIYYFHKATKTVTGSEHPRENPRWSKVGIFAQRKKDRPNHIGLTTVRLVKRTGSILTVAGLDAIDGTPILDIKPVFREFQPRGTIRQPKWVSELMAQYWQAADSKSHSE